MKTVPKSTEYEKEKIRSSEWYGEILFGLFVIGVMKTDKDLVSEEVAKIIVQAPLTWGIGRVPNLTLIAKVIYHELKRKKKVPNLHTYITVLRSIN